VESPFARRAQRFRAAPIDGNENIPRNTMNPIHSQNRLSIPSVPGISSPADVQNIIRNAQNHAGTLGEIALRQFPPSQAEIERAQRFAVENAALSRSAKSGKVAPDVPQPIERKLTLGPTPKPVLENETPESGPIAPALPTNELSAVQERYSQIRDRSEFDAIETVRLSNSPADVWHIRHLSAGELEEIAPFVARDSEGVAQLEGKEEFEGLLGACLFYGLAETPAGGYFFPRSSDGWKMACDVAEDTNPEVIGVNLLLLQGILLMNPAILPEAAVMLKELRAVINEQAAASESASQLATTQNSISQNSTSQPTSSQAVPEAPISRDSDSTGFSLEPSPC
jgi:hypothetical protein